MKLRLYICKAIAYNIPMKSTIETIRECIKKSNLSRYEISKQTGVSQTILYRIVRGGDCMSETADKLLEFFNYELRKKQPFKKGRKK